MKRFIVYAAIGLVVLFSAVITSSSTKTQMTQVNVERKVRIDSITSYQPYSVLPEIKYIYHTSYGNVVDNRKTYNVGDSIVITVVYIEQVNK